MRRSARVRPSLLLVPVAAAFALGLTILPAATTLTPVPVAFGPDLNLAADQPQNVWHVEPAIGGNPINPRNLVAGYFGHTSSKSTGVFCYVMNTLDAGAVWTAAGSVPLGSDGDACFDPSIAADLSGIFYFGYLDAHADSQGSITTIDIRVARSTDGGRSFPTFSTPVTAGTTFGSPNPDKPWLTVDVSPKSRYRGTLYVSYTDFIQPDADHFYSAIKVTTSTDSGTTWSEPITVSRLADYSTSQIVHGSEPVAAPDGSVYVFYMDSDMPATRSAVKFARSRDGGRSWARSVDAASNLPTPGLFQLDNGSGQFGTHGLGILATSFPTAAIAPDGAIYVAWTDFPDGTCGPGGDFPDPACRNADVRLTVSRDGGRSWSAPRKVHDDATQADQFFPWIATGPDGLLSLIWQDRRLDPAHIDYDIFYTNTPDGIAFLPNVRVSSQTSRVWNNFLEGDYSNLAVTSQGIFPIWNDDRFNTTQIFTARGTPAPES